MGLYYSLNIKTQRCLNVISMSIKCLVVIYSWSLILGSEANDKSLEEYLKSKQKTLHIVFEKYLSNLFAFLIKFSYEVTSWISKYYSLITGTARRDGNKGCWICPIMFSFKFSRILFQSKNLLHQSLFVWLWGCYTMINIK